MPGQREAVTQQKRAGKSMGTFRLSVRGVAEMARPDEVSEHLSTNPI